MELAQSSPDGTDSVIVDDAAFEGAAHPLFSRMPSSVSFNKLRKRLLRQVRQALDDFGMLKGSRRWLVGVSGGKDSYSLLALLMDLRGGDCFPSNSSPAIWIRGSRTFRSMSCPTISGRSASSTASNTATPIRS